MYASDVSVEATHTPMARARQVAHSGTTVANPAAHAGAQLPGWIALWLRGLEHGTASALSQGYTDADGRRCSEEEPPRLRLAGRLARFERQRRLLEEFDLRGWYHGSEDEDRPSQLAEHEHLVQALYESRTRLLNAAWMLGAHFQQTGIRPDRIEKTLVAAVDRTLQLVAVADHDLASALVRDLVRRGRQGYHAAMTGAGAALVGEHTPNHQQ
jgi:hypothetical protein